MVAHFKRIYSITSRATGTIIIKENLGILSVGTIKCVSSSDPVQSMYVKRIDLSSLCANKNIFIRFAAKGNGTFITVR